MTDNFEKIEKFLNKEMNEKEREAFERERDKSEELQNEVKFHEDTRAFLKDKADERLKASFEAMGRKMMLENEPHKTPEKAGLLRKFPEKKIIKYSIGIAATFALLWLIKPLWKNLLPNNSIIDKRQYAEATFDGNFLIDPNKSTDSNSDLVFGEAEKLFKEGEFEESLKRWNQLTQDSTQYEVFLFKAASLLKLKEPNHKEALLILKYLDEKGLKNEKFTWLKAYAYLFAGDNENAAKYFHNSVNSTDFGDQAKKVIEDLDL